MVFCDYSLLKVLLLHIFCIFCKTEFVPMDRHEPLEAINWGLS